MRVLIVATLLFFNVALALWHLAGGGRESAGRAIPRTEPDIAPLMLWQERQPSGSAEAGPDSLEPDPMPPLDRPQDRPRGAGPRGR